LKYLLNNRNKNARIINKPSAKWNEPAADGKAGQNKVVPHLLSTRAAALHVGAQEVSPGAHLTNPLSQLDYSDQSNALYRYHPSLVVIDWRRICSHALSAFGT
jgi:hypothetical protein